MSERILSRRMSFLIFLSVWIIPADTQDGCTGDFHPEELCKVCQCSPNLSDVVCQSLNSTEVLRALPPDLVSLKIKRCYFQNLDERLFKNCSSLKYLALERNGLTTISSDLFLDLNESLEYLLIYRSPKLSLSNNLDIFSPLRRTLKYLTILEIPQISQKILEPLENLFSFRVNGEVINRKFSKSFSKLISLKKLILHSFADHVGADTFRYVDRCEYLDLSRANISSIDEDAFLCLENLTHLNLSNNNMINLSMVTPSLRNLSPKITSLNLNFLIGKYYPDASVPKDLFEILSKKPQLKKLYLAKNELLYISWKANHSLRHLKFLDISYNRLSHVYNLVTGIYFMTKLEIINANYQSKRYPGIKNDFSDPWISEVGLGDQENGLDGNDREFDDDCNKMDDEDAAAEAGYDKEHKYNNELEHKRRKKPCVPKNSIKCTFPSNPTFGNLGISNWCLFCPRRLRVLWLKGMINIDLKNLPALLILGDCPIEELHLQKNGIIYAAGQILIDRPTSTKPVLVDLSFNSMKCLHADLFKFSIDRHLTIGKLILEGNSLSHQLADDSKGKTFSRYRHLQVLNLADNKIKVLHRNVFSGLRMLQLLNLSRNSLQILLFNVSDLPNLSFLDLSENLFISIHDVQQDIFSSMSIVRGYRNFTVSFLDNPLQCSCTTIGFLTWIISNVTHIHKFNDLTCLYYTQDRRLNETTALSRYLKLFCYAALPLEIAGSLLGLAMVCGLVGAVLHKYRWDIRYYLLKRAQNKRKHRLSISPGSYFYDAFVCYEKSDRLWVVRELLVNLENPERRFSEGLDEACDVILDSPSAVDVDDRESLLASSGERVQLQRSDPANKNAGAEEYRDSGGLQLCVHERDFEPGCEIKTNVVVALENSRKVILVVSKKFLQSKWCCLELELAKLESLLRGVNMVVTIFLEPIEDPQGSLEWLTKYFTYLEWFQYDEYRRHEFWRRLRISIGRGRKKRSCMLINDGQ